MKVLLMDQIGKINNKYTFSLWQSLHSQGIDVTVITNNTSGIAYYGVDLYQEIWDDYSNKSNKLKKFISYVNSYSILYKYIKKNKPDILHIQWLIFSPIDYYYLKKINQLGVKIIISVHDVLPFNKKFYDIFYHKKIYNMCNHIIAQANENYYILKNDFHIQENKLSMIPHGHFMDFAEIIPKKEARNHLQIDYDDPVVLFFGQIKKVKGLDVLIEAIALATKSYPNIKLLIAGKPWHDDFEIYQRIINKNNLEKTIIKHIKFIPDEEIQYYFSSSDIVALPYKKIYQSGVVQLAYSYEKAVIATNIGGFKDTIEDGVTGLLVPVNDSNALCKGIISYLQNPNFLNNAGIAGKEKLRNELDWNKIARKIISIYTSEMEEPL